MEPVGRPRNHVCKKCNKNFPSGNALGGHMSCHWRNVKQRKNNASPSAIVVDLHVSLQSPIDEKPLLPLSGMQCQMHSNVFSNCKSQREHTRKHSEKMVTKHIEEAAGMMGGLAIVGCDYNAMLFPPVKRKRSKRETPAFNLDEMDAAAALLLLSQHSDTTSASEDCYGLKDVKLDASDHLLVRSDELKKPKDDKSSGYDDCNGQYKKDDTLMLNVPKKHTGLISNDHDRDSTLIPTAPKDSAYEGCSGQSEKDTNLIPNDPKKDKTLILNVPKDGHSISNVPEELELNVSCHELASEVELNKPRTCDLVEQMKCGDLSAKVKANDHQCNFCGRSFMSGQALGGHMRCHHTRCNRRRQGAADCPSSVVIKEQKQKLRPDSHCLISEFQIPLTKTTFA